MHRWFSRFFLYEPRFCVCVCVGGAVYKNIRSLLGPARALAKNQSTFRLHDFFFWIPNFVHLSLLSIFRQIAAGFFSICKSQSHKPRNDLKSSIVFIRYSFWVEFIIYLSSWLIQVVLCQINIFCQKLTQNTTTDFFEIAQIVLKFRLCKSDKIWKNQSSYFGLIGDKTCSSDKE